MVITAGGKPRATGWCSGADGSPGPPAIGAGALPGNHIPLRGMPAPVHRDAAVLPGRRVDRENRAAIAREQERTGAVSAIDPDRPVGMPADRTLSRANG